MNYGSWNVRGLNKRSHQREVLNFVDSNHLSFVGLLETKVKARNLSKVTGRLKKNWSWFANHGDHYNGRILLGWDATIWDVIVVSSSPQFITCNVTFKPANVNVYVSFIYAYNDGCDRVALWDYLSSFDLDVPWCVCGDFNTVLSIHEICGGREHWTPEMQQFKDCVCDAGLSELRTTGELFSWTNRRPFDPVLKRLDRVLVNKQWITSFASSQAFVKTRGIMDHSPIIVNVTANSEKITKGFQFFNFMIGLEGFRDAVTTAWGEPLYGDPMAVFWRKLKGVRGKLVELNRKHGNVKTIVIQRREELNCLQSALALDNRNSTLIEKESKAILALEKALEDEESLLQQKARCSWLKLGDGNNSFFYNQTRANWNSNKVLSLVDSSGHLVRGHTAVSNAAVEFFNETLGASGNQTEFDWDSVSMPQLDSSLVDDLLKPISDDQILSVLKGLKPNKAPGPDGFNREFFLATWDILGNDFCSAVKEFFRTSQLHKGINSTLIALIPKSRTPSTMRDFRPISLCTTMYKCISKILASRLKSVMPSIIDRAQSAFVPGRQISDNILLAQELFRGYGRETGLPKCAFKLDLNKAFDSLDWNFLLQALKHMNFPPVFIGWIKGCICSTHFSVKLNGASNGYFKGAKGLRQGDPMSPYLFSLAMNVLSTILNKVPNDFMYHWKCKELKLTHLFFADDVLIFSRGDRDSILHVMDSMRLFAGVSGLSANYSKSHCFFNNCDRDLVHWFNSEFHMPHGQLPIRFLGVPLISKQLCIGDCIPLIEKITNRINVWTNILLSLAGRLQLLRAVLFAMVFFWSRHFILPKGVHKLLQSIFTRFLWKGDTTSVGGAKVAWDDLCLPKEEGGLGLPNLIEWNNAQIIHYLWLIVNKDETSLWSSWVLNTVLKRKHFWVLSIPFDCSWIWRQILLLRDKAKPFITYVVGDGRSISLWFDPWFKGSVLAEGHSDPIISYANSTPNATLSEIVAGATWVLPTPNPHQRRPSARFDSWVADFDYPPVFPSRMDTALWNGKPKPLVSIKWIWESIRSHDDIVPWFHAVWFKHGIPRFRTHSWLLCLGRLGTLDRLDHWHITTTTTCYLCVGGAENHDHLFLHCHYSHYVLMHLLQHIAPIEIASTWTWVDLLLCILNISSATRRLLALLAVQIYAYHIWRERNARRHGKGVFGPRLLLRGIITDLRARVAHEPWFTTAVLCNPDLQLCISYFE